MKRCLVPLLALFALLLAPLAHAQKPLERSKLYTKPDPQASGGIKGSIGKPDLPIEQILAIPADAPEKVYKGELIDSDRRGFEFTGLPMRKYDLIVIFKNSLYEGLQLHRGESTLSSEDLKLIDAIIQKSEPFFTRKFIHRVMGETGNGNMARCICTFLRDKKSIAYMDKEQATLSKSGAFRRDFKLVLLKDVGPGWQITRTRSLYPIWDHQKRDTAPQHHFSESLARVRVADKVKDLGKLDLSK